MMTNGNVISGIYSYVESCYCYGYTSKVMTTTRLGFDRKQLANTTRFGKGTKLYRATRINCRNRSGVKQAFPRSSLPGKNATPTAK